LAGSLHTANLPSDFPSPTFTGKPGPAFGTANGWLDRWIPRCGSDNLDKFMSSAGHVAFDERSEEKSLKSGLQSAISGISRSFVAQNDS
jgi:hypothetical protein